MMAFILGIWTPLSTVLIPASVSTALKKARLPSRSRIRKQAGFVLADVCPERKEGLM
jgi:hypothetical protein